MVSSFKVGCMRSWRPFCCGWPGLMRSISMPSLSHHTDRLLSPKSALGLAKGFNDLHQLDAKIEGFLTVMIRGSTSPTIKEVHE